jgi:hypothetical protein
MQHSLDILLDIETFADWLCMHDDEPIGTPGTYFNAPLSRYLQEASGHVYGVQERKYGRPWEAETQWNWLPEWAQAFVAHAERYAFREITGEQAFDILAEVVAMRQPSLVH